MDPEVYLPLKYVVGGFLALSGAIGAMWRTFLQRSKEDRQRLDDCLERDRAHGERMSEWESRWERINGLVDGRLQESREAREDMIRLVGDALGRSNG